MLKPAHVHLDAREDLSKDDLIERLYERNARLAVAFQYLIVHVHKFDKEHTACGSYVNCHHPLCQKVKSVIVDNIDAGEITRYQRDRYLKRAVP